MKPYLKKWFIPLSLLGVIAVYFNFFGNDSIQKHNNMDAIKAGDQIPVFSLPDQNGTLFDIKTVLGNKVRKLFGIPTNALGFLPGRVTYVADKAGKVVYIFNSQIQAERHVDEALKILQGA